MTAVWNTDIADAILRAVNLMAWDNEPRPERSYHASRAAEDGKVIITALDNGSGERKACLVVLFKASASEVDP